MHETTGRRFRAVLLDLDGVITRTGTLHARAWKAVFDEFLRGRSARDGVEHPPFDLHEDYLRHVDGKPRLEGVRGFLASRGIRLDAGTPDDDGAGEGTVHGLGNRKNELFGRLLDREPPEVFDDAVEQIRRWRSRGIATALVTSSRNGRRILRAAGLEGLFDSTLDGNDAAERGLPGKPAPDVFLAAARDLGVDPRDAVVVEDAVAGVRAGRAGGFRLVVGVAREGGDALREAGADVVVRRLTDLEANAAGGDGGG